MLPQRAIPPGDGSAGLPPQQPHRLLNFCSAGHSLRLKNGRTATPLMFTLPARPHRHHIACYLLPPITISRQLCATISTPLSLAHLTAYTSVSVKTGVTAACPTHQPCHTARHRHEHQEHRAHGACRTWERQAKSWLRFLNMAA